jgi:voltage-gated sodium channel
VHNHWFEAICGGIILFNMGLVVVETDAGVDDGEAPFWAQVMTNFLLGIYTSELAAKLYAYRLEFFREMWNVLDFLIVGLDLVFLCIGFVTDGLPSVAPLRVFRLVRLARAFKAAKSFPELNSLLRSCSCALRAIFWGMVLMIMVLTVWGILAVQLIHPINQEIAEKTPHVYEGCERCPRAFHSVFDSSLTFWKQLVAGDSWGTLCEPIIEHSPWTSVFFMLVLVTVNLTMLNCILAVVVEAGAAAAAADEHDKAVQREKTVIKAEGKLIDLCSGLDEDDSGSLNIQEFVKGYHENKDFRECLEVMHVTETDMFMIFNICDEDDSGDVDYREFVEQLRRIKHSGEQMLLHYVTDIRHQVNKIRPECLKSTHQGAQKEVKDDVEEKLDDSKIPLLSPGRTAGSPAASTDEVPAVLAEIIKTGGEEDTNRQHQMGPLQQILIKEKSEKSNDDGARYPAAPNSADRLRTAKLERMFQINEELVSIMTDVAQQSKVQTGLLNTLVDGFPSGLRNSADSAGDEAAAADPERVGRDKAPGAADADAHIVDFDSVRGPRRSDGGTRSKNSIPAIPSCCVRVV